MQGVTVTMTQSNQQAIGKAHSKIILIGEHAVVYRKPAIAVPFPIEVTATVTARTDRDILLSSLYYSGSINKAPEALQGITACIKRTLQYIGASDKGLSIQLHSDIPLGRGLGSSAAVAVAAVRSLFAFFKTSLPKRTLMELVEVAEIYAHGKPSGIDMEAVSSEYPIWFQKDKETVPLRVGATMHLIVADSGQTGDTRSAVQKVREAHRTKPLSLKSSLAQIETIAKKAKTALASGNMKELGKLMDANQKELKKMGVSDSKLNALIEASKAAGAYGAKLTGAGQGGCIIALARSQLQAEYISEILIKKGALHTWYFDLEKNGEETAK